MWVENMRLNEVKMMPNFCANPVISPRGIADKVGTDGFKPSATV